MGLHRTLRPGERAHGNGLSPLWVALALAGLVMHVGTALLRLPTFWPYPQMVDFGAFYAAAAALRAGMSPYPWPANWASHLREAHAHTLPLVSLNSFPIWPWLLQPLTALPFPWAAWVWLALLLGVLWWGTRELARLPRVEGRLAQLVLYGLVLSFGPVTLNLTLGQTAVWVLALVLVLASLCSEPTWHRSACAGLLWLVALSTKVYPVLWIPIFVATRCYPALASAIGAAAMAAVVQALVLPGITRNYLVHYLPAQAGRLTEAVLDDQSLGAFLLRFTRPLMFHVPGLSPWKRHAVIWNPPLVLEQTTVWAIAYGVSGLIGLALFWKLYANEGMPQVARMHMWMLFSLTVLPHTERYNHVLLLPPMALLWAQGGVARRYVIVAYFLTGLSRLTHLWILVVPWPLAALLTGSGLAAVWVLIVGILRSYERVRPPRGDR